MMPLKQKIMAIVISVVLIVYIFDLVRRRKLREEYAWVWLLTGGVIFILAVWHNLLLRLASLLGIITPVFVPLFFGLIFLILLCIQFSVRISVMSVQIKNLVQKIVLLEAELGSKQKLQGGGEPDKSNG